MFISRGQIMNSTPFSQELQARIAKYDLLCHPFYKAWSAGELSRDDLREYACQYYHHVAAFPRYLAQFAVRLDDGELRQRSEEHTSELQSRFDIVCRLLLENKNFYL